MGAAARVRASFIFLGESQNEKIKIRFYVGCAGRALHSGICIHARILR
jgi:hypothetical protein